MAMFTIYFDASGAPDNNAALSVAGFVAKAEQWIEFERNWNDALRAYGVSEMHMKNFGPGAGEFASWKNDKVRRRLFLERLISIIKTRVLHSFANSIMLADYRKLDKKFALSEHNRPYALAGGCCIEKVRRWARKRNINEREIAYVFEDGDKDKGSLIKALERDHGLTPNFMKKKDSVAFQAADILAYEHRLANVRVYESGVGTIAFEELRKSLVALDAIPHDGSDWGVYDFSALEKQCILNRYPLRIA